MNPDNNREKMPAFKPIFEDHVRKVGGEGLDQLRARMVRLVRQKLRTNRNDEISASDVVQSALSQVFTGISQFKDSKQLARVIGPFSTKQRFFAWVAKIVINKLDEKHRHYNAQKRKKLPTSKPMFEDRVYKATGEDLAQLRARMVKLVNQKLRTKRNDKISASDVVQSALMQVFTKISQFKDSKQHASDAKPFSTNQRFFAWVAKIVINKLNEKHRNYNAQKRELRKEEPINDRDFEDDLTTFENGISNIWLDVDANLTEIERRVLELTYLDRMTTKQVASELGISTHMVKYYRRTAITKLRHLIDLSDWF